MSQISEEQARALNDLASALKGTTIEEFIKSQLKIKSKDEQEKSDSATKDLTDSETPLAGLKSLLALHADTYISRTLPKGLNFQVPSSAKLYFVLNLMDFHISNNFQARRGIPSLDPMLTRLYMSIVFITQLLRVQHHAGSISNQDSTFLKEFLDQFPPEDLAIPGPCMPIFKSLNCSYPENPDYQRIVSCLPKKYPLLPTSSTNPALKSYTLAERFLNMNHIDWLVAFPPYLAYMRNKMHVDSHTHIQIGADDSASTGRATITRSVPTGNNARPTAFDFIDAKKADRETYFPFQAVATSNSVNSAPNSTPASKSHLVFNIFGNNVDGSLGTSATMNDTTRRCFTKAGIAEPIRINPDLKSQIQKAYNLIDLPQVDATAQIETMAQVFMMEDGFEWFTPLQAYMATYSKFFLESGTLADCSLEGPCINQYVAQIQAPSTALTAPEYVGDVKKLMRFPLTLSTTRKSANRIVEMAAAYACTNISANDYYHYIDTLGDHTRTGDFWQIRPLYDNCTDDKAYMKMDVNISKQLISRPKDLALE